MNTRTAPPLPICLCVAVLLFANFLAASDPPQALPRDYKTVDACLKTFREANSVAATATSIRNEIAQTSPRIRAEMVAKYNVEF